MAAHKPARAGSILVMICVLPSVIGGKPALWRERSFPQPGDRALLDGSPRAASA